VIAETTRPAAPGDARVELDDARHDELEPYVRAYRVELGDTRVRPESKILLLALRGLLGTDDGRAIDRAAISRACGLDVIEIRGALRELQAVGWLDQTERMPADYSDRITIARKS
jgi:hypothetical protein